MAEVIHDAEGDHTHIPATEARQGRRGLHILLVLLASTLLAAVVLFVVWGMRSGDLSDAQKTQVPPTRESTQGQATPPAADPGPTAPAT
ncbi:MAG: hypothetical protein EON95_02185 [Caulobacteraceae bacterium]|nr:hypothetical protein [Caulobacter sp.]RYF95254.1 MAG: hypothetical protein EON95_02185 [Caulobacteraceae bacterium]